MKKKLSKDELTTLGMLEYYFFKKILEHLKKD